MVGSARLRAPNATKKEFHENTGKKHCCQKIGLGFSEGSSVKRFKDFKVAMDTFSQHTFVPGFHQRPPKRSMKNLPASKDIL